MNPIISIIVPVYNGDKYLSRCVDSILNQTFHDWELLLVDDGSTDKSGEICDEYATKDDRIRGLHKSNGGVSSARNYGIRHSRGKWLTFIDIDDYVQDSFLEILIKEANSVDMVVSGAYYINDRKAFLPPNRLFNMSDDLLLLDEQLCSIYLMTCWAKFFKRTFIINEGIYFDISLRIGEDTDFVLRYLKQIRSIKFVHIALYNYNDEEKNKLFKYALSANDFSNHLSLILDSLNQLKKKYNYSFCKFNYLLNDYYSRLFFIYLMNLKNYRNFYKEHRNYGCSKVKYMPDSFKKKVLFFFFVYCSPISYFLFILYRRKYCLCNVTVQ